MNQKIWGPHLWFILHSISFNYPLNPTFIDKLNYSSFINSLKYVLPCGICRDNYIINLKKYPPDFSSRKNFVYWLIHLHNIINNKLGKKLVSRDTVIKFYEKKYNKKIILEDNSIKNNKKKNLIILSLIIIICLSGLIYLNILYK